MSKKIVLILVLCVVAISGIALVATSKSRDIEKSTILILDQLGLTEENTTIYDAVKSQLEENYETIKGESRTIYKDLKSQFDSATNEPVDYSTRELAVANETDPIATINIEGQEPMQFVLYPEKAPESVNNFIYLANSGFYDGLTFHRVVCGFMAQGGDPEGTGTGGPGYSIKGEFTANDDDNDLSNTYGSLAMARSSDYDSAGSQFYINFVDNTSLDGDYAVFGELISGRETLDYLNSDGVCNPTEGAPLEDITIESITVDTRGVEYPEPNKL